MREIKFRGKRTDNGEWVYGNLVYMQVLGAHWTIGIQMRSGDGYRPWVAVTVDPETVGQYTGLKDRDGVEIYEGDVLLIQAKGYDPIISEVVWGGTGYPAFDLPKYDGYGMNAFSAIFHNDVKETLEVIGNIYENPELLEAAE